MANYFVFCQAVEHMRNRGRGPPFSFPENGSKTGSSGVSVSRLQGGKGLLPNPPWPHPQLGKESERRLVAPIKLSRITSPDPGASELLMEEPSPWFPMPRLIVADRDDLDCSGLDS
jgi:hypothetical protein